MPLMSVDQILDSVVFDKDGLVPAIAQDAESGQVLMLAFMSRATLRETIKTGRVVYWSRSRNARWRKGDTSGHIQELVELLIDCDGDTVLLKVRQTGPACHTGKRSCFFRRIENGTLVEIELK
jgi:phosphoribosyl-AMP cyclohydrolase